MKKGCLIILAVMVLGIAGFIALIMGATQPVVNASERFLTQLGQGKSAEAFASTGKALKNGQTQASFDAAVKQLGLDGYQSASWSNRSINNDRGEVKGTVTTKNGAIPLEMVLIKEDGEWRVIGFHGPRLGGSSGAPAAPVPGDEELRKLTLATLLSFNEAVQAKDFTKFHATVSVPLQQQLPPPKLAEAFRSFIEGGLDLSPIQGETPVFSKPPAVDGNGVLALEGYYPTQPSRVHFELGYLYEHPQWKLAGINVRVKKAEESEE